MDFAAWKDRKNVAQALRAVYRAADAKIGQAALDAFAQSPWGEKYPAIAQSWRRNWDLVIPFFAFPEGVRKIIYTNATSPDGTCQGHFGPIARRAGGARQHRRDPPADARGRPRERPHRQVGEAA